ncbi:hypothetical protein K2173_022777 [Erythroxylum novogranatense]|uniref:Uncharacterized protein n=1 Tax=Erythroxylum novogranatense TaxID=1862640 RepID=A0AAV8SMP7_9ROSI|nr:hypothetical protein K2173_022777 [Erythroxylum novogranatense]
MLVSLALVVGDGGGVVRDHLCYYYCNQQRIVFRLLLLLFFVVGKVVIMSQKRQPEEGKARPEGNSHEEKKRRFTWRSVVQEVMKMEAAQHFLEPLIRRVVKEEVESALRRHFVNLKRGKDVNSSESKSLKLHFSNNLSLPIFTGARIEGDEGSLKVVLIDTFTGKIVSSGPESSATVEIVVLEGDFDSEEGENWTHEEFKNNVVREREGKKPLLMGDALLNLKEGIGLVGEVSFTDNSSWTRSRKFRIGAKIVENFDGSRIQEAKTESFVVRDHRGELYKKHHPPSLSDEVWRLEKIGKDGAFHRRLSRENIKTVKDFLTQLFLNPPRLRHILGTGMSAKMWELTVEHARTCVMDKKLYLYCPPGSQQKTGVVFNVVGQVVGLLSGCDCVPVDKLSETEKVEAQRLAITAFDCWEDVVSLDDAASLSNGSLQLSDISYTSSTSLKENSDGGKILSSSGIDGFDYQHPSSSSPNMYSVGGANSMDDYTLHGIENMDLRYDQTLSFSDQVSNPLICDIDSLSQAFCSEDSLRYFDSDLPSQTLGLEATADLQSAVDHFIFGRNTAAVDKAQKRWTKINNVFKVFSALMRVMKKSR